MKVRLLAIPIFSLLLALPLGLLLPQQEIVHAQTPTCNVYWKDPVSGNWHDPTKWSTNTVPSSSDNVCISVGGTYTVTLTGNRQAQNLSIGKPGNTGVQTLRIGGSSHVTLTVSDNLTNYGNITMESSVSSYSASLNVDSGNLTNIGTINVNAGSGGSRQIGASLDNQGTINVNHALNLSKPWGSYANSGTIDIASGKTLTISGTNHIFYQNGGALAVNGACNIIQGYAFYFNGGTITGTPVSQSTRLHLIGTGNANFQLKSGFNYLYGNISTGQTLRIGGGSTKLTILSSGFTNAGTITMESSGGSNPIQLDLPSTDNITNIGTINVNEGSGGTRLITANLNNQSTGILNISDNLSFTKFPGRHTNNGVINVAPDCALTLSGQPIFNQDGGSLTINGAYDMNVGTFNFNGGTFVGTAHLDDSTLNIWTTEDASFHITGPLGRLNGNIASGQTLHVGGDSRTTLLGPSSGFTNAGTIVMESSASENVTLMLLPTASGNITNTGNIDINEGGGGGRLIIAHLNNQGNINISDNLTLSKFVGQHTNSGNINISPDSIFTISANAQTFNNTPPGSITGGGTLELNGIIFNGEGDIEADVHNNPIFTLNIGSSPGVLNIDGDYTESGLGYLNIEIGGTEPGTGYDQVSVTQSATLSGTLNIARIDGFTPDPCDEFTLLTYGSRIDEFIDINIPSFGAGVGIRSVYNENDLTLVAYMLTTPINIAPTSLNVTEGGADDSYKVCLNSQPTDNVTVTPTPSPGGQVNISPTVLIFSPTDWEMPKLVTVSAVDDSILEGPHTANITHTSSSDDEFFDDLQFARVIVDITDNDETIGEITIDIKPGSDPNSINPFSKGRIPVAILADDGFDVTSVNATTVRFGQTGIEAELVHYAFDDVDDDGDIDMICHFRTQETGIAPGDTEATLTANTIDGTFISATDSIRTVPLEGEDKPGKGKGRGKGGGNSNPGQGNGQDNQNGNSNQGQGNGQGNENGNANPGQDKGKGKGK